MNNPPAIHLRKLGDQGDVRVARCGHMYYDPHGERMTSDRARVTCRQCRRLARLDAGVRKEQGE